MQPDLLITPGSGDREWFRDLLAQANGIALYANAADVAHLRRAFLEFAGAPIARAVAQTIVSTEVDAGGVPSVWFRDIRGGRAAPLLYFHGGGYVCGSVAGSRGVAASLAQAFGAPVLAVGYRQAPEHPFPAAVQDANKSYAWLARQAGEPITIVGDSAGGGLAVTAALEAANRGVRAPRAVIAISGVFDLAMTARSWLSNAGKDFATRAMGEFLYGQYLHGASPGNPLASPAYRDDFAKAPPMLILAGSDEMLVGDCELLVRGARAAGASVRYELYEGLPHNFVKFARPVADAAFRRMAQWEASLPVRR